MTCLVLNPYWEVPHHLAVVDLLPKIQEDRGYLAKNGIKVFTLAGGAQRNPATIDWQQLGLGNFPYHLRQDPGPKNALGRIKFIFPNEYNIYLHDTPTPQLFAREQRTFSSGCIRIEKPLALAQLLLRGTPLADPAVLEAALTRADSEIIFLPTPVPVYLLCFTAWVATDGTSTFALIFISVTPASPLPCVSHQGHAAEFISPGCQPAILCLTMRKLIFCSKNVKEDEHGMR